MLQPALPLPTAAAAPRAELSFTLRYSLDPRAVPEDELMQRLYEAGFDDALVGLGMVGMFALDLVKDASTARHALWQAVDQLAAAVPEARLVKVDPGLEMFGSPPLSLDMLQALAEHSAARSRLRRR